MTSTTTVPDMPETGGNCRWDADEYVRHSSAQVEWAKELLGKLALSGAESVLDIGCGDGRITASIARHLHRGRAVGIDNSREMIDRAELTRKESGLANLSFSLVDALELGTAGEFDVAFSNATLHWIHDHATLLANVYRALRPGGRILFQMGGKGNAADVVAVVDEVRAHERWRAFLEGIAFPYFFPDADEYKALVESASFTARRAELIPKDMVQRGRTGLAGWFRTTWMPYTLRLPEGMREEFVSSVVDEFVARHGIDSDGGVHVRMARLEVEAVKPEAPR